MRFSLTCLALLALAVPPADLTTGHVLVANQQSASASLINLGDDSAVVIPVGDAPEIPALKLAHELRHAGFAIEMGYSGNVGRRMKRANRINARAALILGEDELARHAVTLRDLDSGEQAEVPLSEIRDRLARFRA